MKEMHNKEHECNMKSLQWFKNKINHVIYRDDNKCPCKDCKIITKKGLVVFDMQHAEYLFEIQNDLGVEGIRLNYRSKK